MSSKLDYIKQNITSLILKKGKVSIEELLKWCSDNDVGKLTLYYALQEILRNRNYHVEGEYTLRIYKTGNSTLKLSLPEHISIREEKATSKRVVKKKERMAKKSASLLMFEREGEVESKPKEIEREREIEERKEKVKEKDVEKQIPEVKVESEVFEKFKQIFEEEFKDKLSEAMNVLTYIINYLNKYWSVGELRLRLDCSKSLSSKLKINEDEIYELAGKVLNLLKSLGYIEIVEPGVVNKIKDFEGIDKSLVSDVKLHEILNF